MEESDQKKQINQKVTEAEIFPVKVAFGKKNENLSIITNPQIQHSKNQSKLWIYLLDGGVIHRNISMKILDVHY